MRFCYLIGMFLPRTGIVCLVLCCANTKSKMRSAACFVANKCSAVDALGSRSGQPSVVFCDIDSANQVEICSDMYSESLLSVSSV